MSVSATPRPTVFSPGSNCRVVSSAERITMLVDGQAYFDAFVRTALNAEWSITIVGWDFHSHTRLLCEPVAPGIPTELGEFLNYLVKRRRTLRIRILVWDFPVIFGADREFPLFYGLKWKPHRRIELCYDNTHPVGGCHHQKFVVIDHSIAFCGGIDLTHRRWDTCRHQVDDELRVAEGSPYPPFHDVMLMVQGKIAEALTDVAMERWKAAGGDSFAAARPSESEPLWPQEVSVDMEDRGKPVKVALSTTIPAGDQPEIREVEALYVDMIRNARNLIYIENQYFTSQAVGNALLARVEAKEGPEIVIVLRHLSHGWLEALTMENLRTALLQKLKAADHSGRLHIYFPDIAGLKENTCIDVHSKLMIVDDEWLRIGSANCANRSMGLDTECDLTVEAGGSAAVQEFVRSCRLRLLAEHLGASPEQVENAASEVSVAEAIEKLRRSERTLAQLAIPEVPAAILSVAELGDPEQPTLVARRSSGIIGSRAGRWPWLGGIALSIIALVALWRFTPLAAFTDPGQIIAWANDLKNVWWVPCLVVVAYTPASFVMFPRPLITLFSVIAFGPWQGCAYAMAGMLLAAFTTYVIGSRMDQRAARELAGPRFAHIIHVLKKHGLIAITALRLVPLAPFAVEGLVAGAFRIRFLHFMVGTALGLLPGALVATVFGNQITAALTDPSQFNFGILAGALVLLGGLTLFVKRWFSRFDHANAKNTPPAVA